HQKAAGFEDAGELPERVPQVRDVAQRERADDAVEHDGESVTITVGTVEGGEGNGDSEGGGDGDAPAGFFVADDGAGFPADRDDLFEPGVSTKPDGTGFGLAIVRDLAEAHGWDVAATESETGGARVEITGVNVVE
ncbi:hypothetical protein BRD19_08615, partial [Halobacteriales archaeon SW_7_65_23]